MVAARFKLRLPMWEYCYIRILDLNITVILCSTGCRFIRSCGGNIFEWNACCKGGVREKMSKAFAKENAHLSIAEKLEKIKSVPNMGEPLRNEDGTITVKAVNYSDGEKYLCACSNFNGLKYDYSVSKNYCFCCAGHFKHHYEIMLGVKMKTLEIESSPLESNGKNPCVIKFAIL